MKKYELNDMEQKKVIGGLYDPMTNAAGIFDKLETCEETRPELMAALELRSRTGSFRVGSRRGFIA